MYSSKILLLHLSERQLFNSDTASNYFLEYYFIKQNIKYLDLLKSYLVENAKIYQHFYATLYPKFYSHYNKFGAENQSIFGLCYREWIKKRKNYEAGVGNNKKTSIKQAEVTIMIWLFKDLL